MADQLAVSPGATFGTFTTLLLSTVKPFCVTKSTTIWNVVDFAEGFFTVPFKTHVPDTGTQVPDLTSARAFSAASNGTVAPVFNEWVLAGPDGPEEHPNSTTEPSATDAASATKLPFDLRTNEMSVFTRDSNLAARTPNPVADPDVGLAVRLAGDPSAENRLAGVPNKYMKFQLTQPYKRFIVPTQPGVRIDRSCA